MASTLTIAVPNPRVLLSSIIATSIISTATPTATTTTATTTLDRNVPDTLSTTTLTAKTLTSNDVDAVPTCNHCDSTFISCIGLVDHLRVHRTAAGEPVPGAPTYTCRIRLHCPHTFIHRMGLFGLMRIHDSGIHLNINTPSNLT
ncbi:hypothetical protein SprV_0200906500 [Sparganum proliferum]